MKLLNRNAPRGLARRWADGDELTTLERGLLLEAVAADLELGLRGMPAMNGPWSRAQTILTLAAQFITSMHHRAAIAREAESLMATPKARRQVLRLVQGPKPPSKLTRFLADWLGGGETGRGGAA